MQELLSRVFDRATATALVLILATVCGWKLAPEQRDAVVTLALAAFGVFGVWVKAPKKGGEK